MRISFCLVLAASGLAIAGCARNNSAKTIPKFDSITGSAPVTAPAPANTFAEASVAEKVIPKPVEALSGKVSSANANLKFVVLTFPIGQMAALNQKLNIYRAGVKVGELVVTGPQRDENIIADLVGGEAQVGDEAHD
jgi:hypothetical protein